jgi:hypothetical protein
MKISDRPAISRREFRLRFVLRDADLFVFRFSG